MSQTTTDHAGTTEKRRKGAVLRGLALGLAFFAAGAALSAWWFLRPPAATESVGPPALSDATVAVLGSLGSPVEIRFYSLLDPVSVGDSGRDFSGRVDQLLSQYEQGAGGKIKITRVNSMSDSDANAAAADGIKPFNLDKGNACFLGLAVVRGNQKQSIPLLAPEWEAALQSDLSRLIAGLDAPAPNLQPTAKPDVASLAAVRRAFPNLETVSVKEGSQLLRAAALAPFAKTKRELDARLKQAEQRFLEAQSALSQAGQEAALKDLRQIRDDQAESLREIALQSKAQVAALQLLKGAAH